MQYEMPFCTKISLPTEAAVADHHVVAMLAAKQPCFGACLGCVELQFCIAARARNVKHMHAARCTVPRKLVSFGMEGRETRMQIA